MILHRTFSKPAEDELAAVDNPAASGETASKVGVGEDSYSSLLVDIGNFAEEYYVLADAAANKD